MFNRTGLLRRRCFNRNSSRNHFEGNKPSVISTGVPDPGVITMKNMMEAMTASPVQFFPRRQCRSHIHAPETAKWKESLVGEGGEAPQQSIANPSDELGDRPGAASTTSAG